MNLNQWNPVKVAKFLPQKPTLQEQIKILKSLVLIKNEDFSPKTTGIVVSLQQFGGYWVLLDVPYKKKNGKYSRKRFFKETELRLI